jgi:sulfide:quinone oxidoreductase
MGLLKETRANHLGKLAFRWIYWNVLLPGRPLPLPALMSMAGKVLPPDDLPHATTAITSRRSDAPDASDAPDTSHRSDKE